MPSCPYQNRERSCWSHPISLVRSSVVDIRSRRARSLNHIRACFYAIVPYVFARAFEEMVNGRP